MKLKSSVSTPGKIDPPRSAADSPVGIDYAALAEYVEQHPARTGPGEPCPECTALVPEHFKTYLTIYVPHGRPHNHPPPPNPHHHVIRGNAWQQLDAIREGLA